MTKGDRVREIRTSQDPKMSMEAFAARLGVTKTAISLVESGKNDLSDQMARSICREFGVNEAWLRTGEGLPYPSKSKQDEIAALVASYTNDSGSFRKALITTLLRFDPGSDKWKLLEEIYNSVVTEYEREKDQTQQPDADAPGKTETE